MAQCNDTETSVVSNNLLSKSLQITCYKKITGLLFLQKYFWQHKWKQSNLHYKEVITIFFPKDENWSAISVWQKLLCSFPNGFEHLVAHIPLENQSSKVELQNEATDHRPPVHLKACNTSMTILTVFAISLSLLPQGFLIQKFSVVLVHIFFLLVLLCLFSSHIEILVSFLHGVRGLDVKKHISLFYYPLQ